MTRNEWYIVAFLAGSGAFGGLAAAGLRDGMPGWFIIVTATFCGYSLGRGLVVFRRP